MLKKILYTFVFIIPSILLLNCSDLINDISKDIEAYEGVTKLDSIKTGLSIAIYDADTKKLIKDEITLTIDSSSLPFTINAKSKKLIKTTFKGGMFNIGISKKIVPKIDIPIPVYFNVSAKGYLTKKVSVLLTTEDYAYLEVEMFSEANPPRNLFTTTLFAPLDSNGKPLPLENPFDSVSEQNPPELKAPKANRINSTAAVTDFDPESNTIAYFDLSPSTNQTIWKTSQGDKIGHPYAYQYKVYAWDTIPETVERYTGYKKGLYIENLADYVSIFQVTDFKIKMSANDSFVSAYSAVNKDVSGEVIPTKYRFSSFSPSVQNSVDWFNSIHTGSHDYYYYTSTPNKVLEAKFGMVETLDAIYWTGIDPLPAFLYTDSTNIFKKFFYSIASEENTEDSTLYNYSNFTALRGGDLKLKVKGYGEEVVSLVSVLMGGITVFGAVETDSDMLADMWRQVGLTYAKITIWLPYGPYSEYHNLTGYAGETIIIDVPNKNDSVINVTLNANLKCKSSSKKVRLESIPNTSVRYVIKDSENKHQVGDVTAWNCNKDTQILTSATIALAAIEKGKTYTLSQTVSGQTFSKDVLLDSANVTTTLTIPNEYCDN